MKAGDIPSVNEVIVLNSRIRRFEDSEGIYNKDLPLGLYKSLWAFEKSLCDSMTKRDLAISLAFLLYILNHSSS